VELVELLQLKNGLDSQNISQPPLEINSTNTTETLETFVEESEQTFEDEVVDMDSDVVVE
jgi:hypothetical protein